MKELQEMVGGMREAYGLIDEPQPSKKNKRKKRRPKKETYKEPTSEELKEQLDQMQQLLKSNPKLQYQHGK